MLSNADKSKDLPAVHEKSSQELQGMQDQSQHLAVVRQDCGFKL